MNQYRHLRTYTPSPRQRPGVAFVTLVMILAAAGFLTLYGLSLIEALTLDHLRTLLATR